MIIAKHHLLSLIESPQKLYSSITLVVSIEFAIGDWVKLLFIW